jgi:murein DD-endopeptidase MepM/ murein hydrolase activator NlpD
MLALTAGLASAAARPVPRLVFPVVGPVSYINDFGAPRGSSRHEGNDLMAPKRALAVAAEAGKVKFWTTSTRAGCMLYLYGDSGTTYLYVHLNNDLTAKNDNRGLNCEPGVAFAPGLKSGQRVEAGEWIAYVGDSGDADGGASHLHFEVHPGDGAAVSPFNHLNRSRKLLWSARSGPSVQLSLTGTLTSFVEGRLVMRVASLRILPKGPTIAKVGRTLELQLAPNAVIERAGLPVTLARLAKLPAASPLVVTTSPGGTSLNEKLGAPGALLGERVLLKPTT